MFLVQVKFAFELPADRSCFASKRGTGAKTSRAAQGRTPARAFSARASCACDSPILLDFLQIIDRRQPKGWSVAARDQLSGREWSLGSWWPPALRPHEH